MTDRKNFGKYKYVFAEGEKPMSVYAKVFEVVSTDMDLPGKKNFDEEIDEMYDGIVKGSFTEALTRIFSQRPSLKNLILNKELVYTGPHPRVNKLFIDSINDLIYGEEPMFTVDEVVNAFLADKIMVDALTSGNSDIEEYVGLTPLEIVDIYGRDDAIREYAHRKDARDIVSLFNDSLLSKTVYDIIQNPGHAAHLIQKNHFRDYAKVLLEYKKSLIFSVYAQKVSEYAYPDLDKRAVVQTTISEMPAEQFLDLRGRLYELYKLGILKVETDSRVPTEKTIKRYETMDIPETARGMVKSENTVDLSGTLLNYTNPLVFYINDVGFPTIAHYVSYNLNDGQVSHGQLIPEIYDKYILLPNIELITNQVISENSIQGDGELPKDLLGFRGKEKEFFHPYNEKVVEITGDFCFKTMVLMQKNTELLSGNISTFIPACLFWVSNRMDKVNNLDKIISEINNVPNRPSKMRLLAGPCVKSRSDSITRDIKKGLYDMMTRVIGSYRGTPMIVPFQLEEYAQLSIQVPDVESSLPRSIRLLSLAVKKIRDILVEMTTHSEYLTTIYAINILVNTYLNDPEGMELYDDNTDRLKREFDLDTQSCALINGFANDINDGEENLREHVYRRVIFYMNI